MNQSILKVLITNLQKFLNLQKKVMENSTPRKQLPSNISDRKKISNEDFNFCEAKFL